MNVNPQSQECVDLIRSDQKTLTFPPTVSPYAYLNSWGLPTTNCKGYTQIQGYIFATADSDANGLLIEQSVDGVNFDIKEYVPVKANTAIKFVFAINADLIRLTYSTANPATVRISAVLVPISSQFDAEDLRRILEIASDTGDCSADSGVSDLIDTAKDWKAGLWINNVVEITEGVGKGQFKQITGNTATALDIAPDIWAVPPKAGSKYRINPLGVIVGSVTADITKWGGTPLTGRDITPDLKQLTDQLPTIAGDTTSIDGKITACDTGAVVVASGAITETNSGTINTNQTDGSQIAQARVYDSTGATGITATGTSLDVNVSGGAVVITPPSGISQGRKTILVNATPEQLIVASTPCVEVEILADVGNTGAIRIGGVGLSGTNGAYLNPGDMGHFNIDDLNKIYVYGTAGDILDFTYFT